MALAFGESYWDYLPDLVQNYIEDLAARNRHRDRMKHVCESIKLHKQWCNQQIWLTELFFYSYKKFLDLVLFFLNHKYVINV